MYIKKSKSNLNHSILIFERNAAGAVNLVITALELRRPPAYFDSLAFPTRCNCTISTSFQLYKLALEEKFPHLDCLILHGD